MTQPIAPSGQKIRIRYESSRENPISPMPILTRYDPIQCNSNSLSWSDSTFFPHKKTEHSTSFPAQHDPPSPNKPCKPPYHGSSANLTPHQLYRTHISPLPTRTISHILCTHSARLPLQHNCSELSTAHTEHFHRTSIPHPNAPLIPPRYNRQRGLPLEGPAVSNASRRHHISRKTL